MQFVNIDDLSLEMINDRDTDEFSRLYEALYNNMYNFAFRIYGGTPVEAKDVINDIFLRTWGNKKIRFQTLESIKPYFIISIRNGYNDYIRHNNRAERYRKTILSEQSFAVQVAETEVFSLLSHAMSLLPEQCARVFGLWVKGWTVKEIAQHLDKADSTVYIQKQRAIDILKEKLGDKALLIIFCVGPHLPSLSRIGQKLLN